MKTADRTLDVFELFSRERRPLNLSRIAEALGIPLSSSHAIVKTLRSRGYLYELGRREGYYPSGRLAAVAEAIARATPVAGLVGPVLEALRDEAKESVVLAKRQRDHVVYLHVVEAAESVRFSPVVGETKPLHTTASGKAILAAMGPEAREELLARVTLPAVTERSVGSARELREEIERGLRRGWWLVDGENTRDLMAIAAPVRVAGELFAVVIGGPPQRFQAELRRHAARLLRACRAIERSAGSASAAAARPPGGDRGGAPPARGATRPRARPGRHQGGTGSGPRRPPRTAGRLRDGPGRRGSTGGRRGPVAPMGER